LAVTPAEAGTQVWTPAFPTGQARGLKGARSDGKLLQSFVSFRVRREHDASLSTDDGTREGAAILEML
jgi:hypothetical protein